MPARRKKFFTPIKITLGCVFMAVILTLSLWLIIRDANVAVLDPQGLIAKQQRDLIIFTVLLSVVVVAPVFTLLGVFAYKYRDSNKKATYTPDEEGNKWLEILWWGIPIIIIGALSVVTWVTSHQLDPYKPISSNVPALKVQAVALQWKWLFIYPDQNIASVNELKIPAGTPIELEITADAPMSAFWIPSLAGQTYAMNGMTSKLHLVADKPGTYRGTNTNINGEGYSEMYFNAVALKSRDAFDSWVNTVRYGSAQSIDFATYEKLAEPSKGVPVTYYKLSENALYTEIMNKYMSGHSEDANTDGHSRAGH